MVKKEKLETMKKLRTDRERTLLDEFVKAPIKTIDDVYKKLEELAKEGDNLKLTMGVVGLVNAMNMGRYLEIITQEDYNKYNDKCEKLLTSLSGAQR